MFKFFAWHEIKGGGHSGNPGFSSTQGVLIAMRRFNQTKYHSKKNVAEVGVGTTWDQVYDVLTPLGVNVLGGRIAGNSPMEMSGFCELSALTRHLNIRCWHYRPHAWRR